MRNVGIDANARLSGDWHSLSSATAAAEVLSRPRVVAYTDCDLIMTSYAVAGLIDAAERGSIDLEFRLSLGRYRGKATLWLRVGHPSGRQSRLVCLDLHDKASYFCPEGLAASELYYKSNLRRNYVMELPPEQQRKLRPLGPFWYCRSDHDRALPVRVIGSTLSNLRWSLNRSARITIRGLAHNALRYRRYRRCALVPDCEAAPTSPVKNQVFFYAQCYPLGKGNDEITETRARVIRALKTHLGSAFVGGFAPDTTAQSMFPDCVSPRLGAADYVRTLKESSICIYTNGNQGCISSKLDMFLAASKVIVAEPWDGELVAPLNDGQDVFLFRSVDECVAICEKLLRDPELCAAVRKRSARYYEQHVRPAARMETVVAQALATMTT